MLRSAGGPARRQEGGWQFRVMHAAAVVYRRCGKARAPAPWREISGSPAGVLIIGNCPLVLRLRQVEIGELLHARLMTAPCGDASFIGADRFDNLRLRGFVSLARPLAWIVSAGGKCGK
jgi:hypothetical protein